MLSLKISPSSSFIFRELGSAAPVLATITMSQPWGKWLLCNLKNSLISRLTLFLFTAFPIFLLTVIPNLVMSDPFRFKMILKCAEGYRFPCRFRLTKFFRFNSLSFFEKENEPMYIYLCFGLSGLIIAVKLSASFVLWPFSVLKFLCHLLWPSWP